jgi:hypothetical protein
LRDKFVHLKFVTALESYNVVLIKQLAHLFNKNNCVNYYTLVIQFGNNQETALKICKILNEHKYDKNVNVRYCLEIAIDKKFSNVIKFFVLEEPKVDYSKLGQDDKDYIEEYIVPIKKMETETKKLRFGLDKVIVTPTKQKFDVDKYFEQLSAQISQAVVDPNWVEFSFSFHHKVSLALRIEYIKELENIRGLKVIQNTNTLTVILKRVDIFD